MTKFFAERFPERFFDCGIAEQNMIGIAAGLAASGKTVFASTFAVFATGRCFDQLRMSVSQPGLNVKVVSTHAGVTVGEDGFSHHSIEDIALACSLPSFTVIVPADANEATQAVRTAASTDGPFYIRLSRSKSPLVYPDDYRFTIGKAVLVRQGRDATIIANGLMVTPSLKAAERLQQDKISCRVLSMPTVKPLDEEAILLAAKETGAIVTAEEHLEHGGLGSRVAQVVVKGKAVPMSLVAIKNIYTKSGKPEQLLQKCGLTAENIEAAVRETLKRK
jgi:transketolase